MIVDSSAVVAITVKEPDFDIILAKLFETENCAIGAPTFVETAIVLSARLGRDARGLLSRFVDESGIEIIHFGHNHYTVAVQAWLQYGKGRHPASLNYGDCLCYATAKVADQPLLCTGHDFNKTDLKIV